MRKVTQFSSFLQENGVAILIEQRSGAESCIPTGADAG
jgi:hypothetical protein